VLGAATSDILKLLLWQFSKPVLLANLVAWPVAWFALRRWLDGFAYRIDMPVTAFAAASFAALLIAFSAVAAHALKVARTSPALALRHD
jgi:putative ABC transport system permease protein